MARYDGFKRVRREKKGFGWWLLHNMDKHNWNCEDVAVRLDITRQTVSNHVVGRVKPTFVGVVAYCWLFDFENEPEEIWNMIWGIR